MNEKNSVITSRRDFIRASGAVTAGLVAAPYVLTRGAELSPGDTIKVGLIGCGRCGSGAVKQALNGDKNVQLIAMADVFENQLKSALSNLKKDGEVGEKFKVEDTKMFV